ncbi:HNH endonuclease [Paraburkholderia youngii]|uniref:5-methylcytosine-specific restriction protein A n=1 Tax=Paraburkholderia youngii TaxID=2782701 RepID=A0A7W8P316_9BURK|nr:HNH endonuclease [Paraburkholderia youngii]MBB5400560.1 5-methylcytosine-specific restriction protein A [Paraburkholderia youngii]
MANTVPPQLFEDGYIAAQEVLAGRATAAAVRARLIEQFGLAARTVDGYWQCHIALLKGTKFRHTLQADGWRFNLTKFSEMGPVALMTALETFMEHIVYLKMKTGGNEPGLHRVHEEFVRVIQTAAVFNAAGIELDGQVVEAMAEPADVRSTRLRQASMRPEQQLVLSRVFKRNPYVIAEVLLRAAGICESCRGPAPFTRADGRPYLEVHHLIRLADGGDDTIENAIAVCPNCHRERHFGASYSQPADVVSPEDVGAA